MFCGNNIKCLNEDVVVADVVPIFNKGKKIDTGN